MKTATAVLVVMLVGHGFAASSSLAQTRFGVHGGLNLSKFREPDENSVGESWTMQSHILGGIVLDLELSNRLLLVMKMDFTQRSVITSNRFRGLSLAGHTTFTNDCIEIPIYIRWRMGEGPLRGFIEGGSTVGIVVSAKACSESPGLETTTYEVGAVFRKRI